jgi:hypothetical protein
MAMTTQTIGIRDDRLADVAHGAARWLGLAAAPTFALLAVVTGISGDGANEILCAAAQHASPLGGMVSMYLVMAAVHAAPWLKLIANPRSGVEGC